MPSLGAILRSAKTLFLSGLLFSFSLAGCDGSSGDGPTEPDPVATTVFVTGSKEVLTSLGETAQFTAQVRDQAGEVMTGVTVLWSSATPSVVTIDPASGVATAVSNGNSIITATAGSATGAGALTVAQAASGIAKVRGDAQTGTVGAALPVEPAVRVQDAGGNPVAGITVAFQVTSGGGSVGSAQATTSSTGEASSPWTLGTDPSETQTLTATGAGSTLEFTATALPAPPATLTPLQGDAQTGYSLEPLPLPLVVEVKDSYGNPLAGEVVSWSVTAGAGALSASSSTTDGDGKAQVSWTLGQTAGAQGASATVGALPTVAFSATALPNAIISGTVTVQSGALSAPPPSSPARPLRVGVPEPQDVPGELIVVFRPDAPMAVAPGTGVALPGGGALAASSADLEIVSLAPALPAALVQARGEADLDELIRSLRALPNVLSVEPNRRHSALPARIQADPGMPPMATPGPISVPQRQQWPLQMLKLPEAWTVSGGSSTVTVAVLDDGIRSSHPALSGVVEGNGYDLVRDVPLADCVAGFVGSAGDGDGPDADPTTPFSAVWNPAPASCISGANATGGTGTAVSALIAAPEGQIVVGVAPGVQVRPIRIVDVAGFFEEWALVNGILYAAGLPVDVGGGQIVQAPGPVDILQVGVTSPTLSEALEGAVAQAMAAGVLIVAPVGDDAMNQPVYPASIAGVVGVSAVGPSGGIASYSSLGSSVDVAGPGGDQNAGDFSYGVFSALWDFNQNAPSSGWLDGTRMAAAHITGLAALLKSAEPGLDAGALRGRITSHADQATPAAWYGAGRADAAASLTQGAGVTGDLFVRLVDAVSGATLQTVQAGAGGTYSMSRLTDGSYWVLAGEDRRGDGTIGGAGRPWGAFGGITSPTTVAVSGGGAFAASFAVAQPTEAEPNNVEASANELLLGGYVEGSIPDPADLDYFRVVIPEDGTYTFGTEGIGGGCGLTRAANTVINLVRPGSILVALNDDRDPAGWDFCSGVTATLTAGTYYVQVTGSLQFTQRGPEQFTGGYLVWARKDG